jgi:chondroitin AC lyase
MDYNHDGVAAHKAWFFGEDVIFCLGAGIRSDIDARIATTINQSLLRGPVTAEINGRQSSLALGESELEGVDWIEHDGWRYAFAQPASVRFSAGKRTGNWSQVFKNAATPAGDVSKDVFTLWLDHGAMPLAAEYAYAILPAGEKLAAPVLANSEAMQAVSFDDHRTAVIFWKPGKLSVAGVGEIESDHPCVLLVDSLHQRASVSDPTQSLSSLILNFAGHRQELQLPTGGQAGRAIEVILK